jgi:uncharacterized membrane protein
MRIRREIYFVIIASLLVCACAPQKHTAEEIQIMVNREIKAGASSGEIEAFLRKQKIKFSYDKFAGRYQSLIRRGEFSAIVLYVNVDERKRFVRAEAQNSYTGL